MNTRILALSSLVAAPALLIGAALPGMQEVGYSDTPFLPGGEWRVHDSSRPAPEIVTPGEGMAPPSDAIVLFDGTNLDAWSGGPWELEDGAMTVNGSGGIATKQEFGDCQLHIEWASPDEVAGESQGRGNSGVFLMGRYEIQVLDSFENRSYSDGQAAAMYGQYPPAVNASRGPGEWQAYDIFFRAPRFDGDELAEPALVTVLHNGVLVHHAREFLGATAHRKVAAYRAHPEKSLIRLQDHGNPVRFRNIWLREL
ncbi:MAG: DUF1080 domain-containing protein [Planctomycetota bacterium]